MKVRVIFYKNSKTKFGELIRFQQRRKGIYGRYAKYSHTEIVFPYYHELLNEYDKIIWIHDGTLKTKHGISFSSSEVDGGCRFKCIDYNTNNWDSVEIEVTKEQYLDMLLFCRTQNGNSYGMIGIFFAQILNFDKKRPWTRFCSEIVTRCLQEIWMLCPMNALFTKPWELASELEAKWYIISN